MGQTKFCIFSDCEAERRAVSLRYQFCPMQNSLYVQVLRSPNIGSVCYCTALQQRASAKLRRRTRNGITELSQTVPPIFCRGYHVGHRYIGPHSSLIGVSTFEPFIRRCSQCHVTPCRVPYLRWFFTIDDSTRRNVARSRVAYFKSNLKVFHGLLSLMRCIKRYKSTACLRRQCSLSTTAVYDDFCRYIPVSR